MSNMSAAYKQYQERFYGLVEKYNKMLPRIESYIMKMYYSDDRLTKNEEKEFYAILEEHDIDEDDFDDVFEFYRSKFEREHGIKSDR